MFRRFPANLKTVLCALIVPIFAVGILWGGEFEAWANPRAKLETSSRLAQAPGGMTIGPDGSIFLSIHQFQGVKVSVVEVTPEGKVHAFPRRSMSATDGTSPLKLDSVLGLQSDRKGVIWMLDNGRRGEVTPKLVAWDSREDKLHKVIYLPRPTTTKTSFVNDLALNPEDPYIYISDPAGGSDAALIVVNTETGYARRVLAGHYSVIPGPLKLMIDGKPVASKRVDGTLVKPFAGAGPIAVDRKGDWVYFGPMVGDVLYRIRAAALHDETLSARELAAKVESWSNKPICDGISIDSKGNVYVSDIASKAIGIIDPKSRQYDHYIRHADFLWPDGLCFGSSDNDRLYFFASQLHRMPTFAGRQATQPPFYIFKIKALADGTTGR